MGEDNRTDLLEEDVIDIREYIKFLWRKKWFLLLVIIISFLTTLIVLLLQPRVYETESAIALGKISGTYVFSKGELKALITSTDIFKGILEKKGEWKRGMSITVETLKDAEFIKLKVQGEHPEELKEFCLDLSTAITKYGNEEMEKKVLIYKRHFEELISQKDSIKREIEQIKTLLAEEGKGGKDKEEVLFRGILLRNILSYYRQLLTQLEQKEVNLKLLLKGVEDFRIIKFPELPRKPVQPRYMLSLVISIFVGVFISIFLAFLLEFLRKIDWST